MNDNIYDEYPNYSEFETSSFEERVSLETSALRKLQLDVNGNKGNIVCDTALRSLATNVLNRTKPTLKLSQQVGLAFSLKGFYTETITYKKDNKTGEFTFLFGNNGIDQIAITSSSRKVAEAVQKILLVYGEIKDWDIGGIPVKICMNTSDDIKSYSLEVLD
jgi:hypothetical protein